MTHIGCEITITVADLRDLLTDEHGQYYPLDTEVHIKIRNSYNDLGEATIQSIQYKIL